MVRSILSVPLLYFVFVLSLAAQNGVDWRIKQVYGDYLKEVETRDPERLVHLDRLLNERVTVVTLERTEGEKFAKLSAMPLFNKYNPALERDVTYDPKTFNVLKYDLTFFSRTVMVYRIDGTDLVIVIRPMLTGGTNP